MFGLISNQPVSEPELRSRLAAASFSREAGAPLTLDPDSVRVHRTPSGLKFYQVGQVGPITYGQLLLLSVKVAASVAATVMAASITWMLLTWTFPAVVAGALSFAAALYASWHAERLERDYGTPVERFKVPLAVRGPVFAAAQANPAEALLALRRMRGPDQDTGIDTLLALYRGKYIAAGTGIPQALLYPAANRPLAAGEKGDLRFGFQPSGGATQ